MCARRERNMSEMKNITDYLPTGGSSISLIFLESVRRTFNTGLTQVEVR